MDIKIIYSKKHLGHNPPYELYDGVSQPFAEKPERVEAILTFLLKNKIGRVYQPFKFPIKHICKVHQKGYVSFLKRKSRKIVNEEVLYPSYFMMDTYTPLTRRTYEAARVSVDVALTGAKKILQGDHLIYSLCRPPGHHAEIARMGGYCYFNNAAIAANYLSLKGKVAILDIDFHHGNGTQALFYERKDIFYVSIHADPRVKFPYSSGFKEEIGVGKGKGFNKNYPLPLGTKNKDYLKALRKAINDVKKFNPKFLVVSAGFDTYKDDPIGGFKLTVPFFKVMGKEIAGIKKPTLIIQEGGYAIDKLGEIALNFLNGFNKVE